MISATNIREVGFSRQHRGYNMTEVDDILEQAASTVEELQMENAELSRKLEVLADRIQEYRNEEDSIRSALLTAQKSADKILKEAGEEKNRLQEEATTQANATVQLAEDKAKSIAVETQDKVTTVINEAKNKAAQMLSDAKAKSDSMLSDTMKNCAEEKQYLAFLKEQEELFRQSIIDMYRAQFELLKKGPEAVKTLETTIENHPEPQSFSEMSKQIDLQPQAEEFVAAEEEPQPADEEPADKVTFTEPEDIPLPFAESHAEETAEEDVWEDEESEESDDSPAINNGFAVNRRFGDLKFGDDYDISADDDYDDPEENDQ